MSFNPTNYTGNVWVLTGTAKTYCVWQHGDQWRAAVGDKPTEDYTLFTSKDNRARLVKVLIQRAYA